MARWEQNVCRKMWTPFCTPARRATRRMIARFATPSLIARSLVSWRLGLEDRILREIPKRPDLKNVEELCWA